MIKCCIINLVFQYVELQACLPCAIPCLRVNIGVMIHGGTEVISHLLLTRERPCQVTFVPSYTCPFYVPVSIFPGTSLHKSFFSEYTMKLITVVRLHVRVYENGTLYTMSFCMTN
jgi:hypothetical protein